MEWITQINRFEKLRVEGTSIALGAFDGLHRGHVAVLQAAAQPPFEKNWGVFTFSAPPFEKQTVLPPQDKKLLLHQMGAEFAIAPDFAVVQQIPAESFATGVLLEQFHAKRLCCGEDFRFGRNAEGDVTLLQALCDQYGVQLVVVPEVQDDEGKISSTRIRTAVEQGDIETANALLGREFQYTMPVIHGNHIGTGLGTPTLNQAMPQGLILPPFGVYASLANTGDSWYFGVTNIGVKPTVGSDSVLSETWLPRFSGDLYGKQVTIRLLKFLRAERKFASLEELRAEIQKNAVQAEKIALQMKADMLQ